MLSMLSSLLPPPALLPSYCSIVVAATNTTTTTTIQNKNENNILIFLFPYSLLNRSIEPISTDINFLQKISFPFCRLFMLLPSPGIPYRLSGSLRLFHSHTNALSIPARSDTRNITSQNVQDAADISEILVFMRTQKRSHTHIFISKAIECRKNVLIFSSIFHITFK